MDIMSDMSYGELLLALCIVWFLVGVSGFVLYKMISLYGLPW